MALSPLYVRLDKDLLRSVLSEIHDIPSVTLTLPHSSNTPAIPFRAIVSYSTSSSIILRSFHSQHVKGKVWRYHGTEEDSSVVPMDRMGYSPCVFFTSSSAVSPKPQEEEAATQGSIVYKIPGNLQTATRIPFSYRQWSFSPAFLVMDHLGFGTLTDPTFVAILGRNFFDRYGFDAGPEPWKWAIKVPPLSVQCGPAINISVRAHREILHCEDPRELPMIRLYRALSNMPSGTRSQSIRAEYRIDCHIPETRLLSAPMWHQAALSRHQLHDSVHRTMLRGIEQAMRMLYRHGITGRDIILCLSDEDVANTLFQCGNRPYNYWPVGQRFPLLPRARDTLLESRCRRDDDLLRLIEWWVGDLLRMGTRVHVSPAKEEDDMRARNLAQQGPHVGRIELLDEIRPRVVSATSQQNEASLSNRRKRVREGYMPPPRCGPKKTYNEYAGSNIMPMIDGTEMYDVQTAQQNDLHGNAVQSERIIKPDNDHEGPPLSRSASDHELNNHYRASSVSDLVATPQIPDEPIDPPMTDPTNIFQTTDPSIRLSDIAGQPVNIGDQELDLMGESSREAMEWLSESSEPTRPQLPRGWSVPEYVNPRDTVYNYKP